MLGNRGLTALLEVQRAEGWAGQAPSSKNRGGPTAITAPGGWRTVRRHAIRGLSSPEMLTDMLIAVIPDGLPRDGSAVDVLVHLHGHRVMTEAKDGKPARVIHGTGYEDARAVGGSGPIDLGVMQLEEQMSAAGRPLIGLLPQGSAGSDFAKGQGAGFDLGKFVTAAFKQLTADQAWDADGSSGDPPTPGRASLSGHSGADQPITQMLSGGKADDLAGLFLFDTMYVTDAEKKAKKKLKVPTPDNWKLQLEGKVEAYVKARFDDDLVKIQAAKAADRRAWVEQRGFRLSVVHAAGSGRYTESSDRLRDVVIGWIDALDPAVVGADTITAIRKNYVFKTAAKGKTHMEVMGDGNFAGAIAMLPAVGGDRCQAGAVARRRRRCSGRRRRCCRRPATGPPHGVLARSPAGPSQCSATTRAPVDHVAEFAAFNVRGAIEGGLEGYKGIREVFINTFGSIARANTYYAGRAADALPRSVANRPCEHAGGEAGQRRAGAQGQGLARPVAAALTKAGGFNIRRNRNAPSRLSDHSFGWAVDLDDSLNPNLSGRFPGRALMAATGSDVVTGAMDTVGERGQHRRPAGSDRGDPRRERVVQGRVQRRGIAREGDARARRVTHEVPDRRGRRAARHGEGGGWFRQGGPQGPGRADEAAAGQLGEHPGRRAVAGGRRP